MNEGPATKSNDPATLLYCHCAYAQVVPVATKSAVLAALASSGRAFDAVADLCEMSARRDPALARYAASKNTRIAACFPRAVSWLFHAADAPLNEDGVTVLNMRDETPETVLAGLLSDSPNRTSPNEGNER